jgi:hypothetical protein
VTTISYSAELDPEPTPGRVLPGSWFITHPLGRPAGNTYTEVAFAPDVAVQPRAVLDEVVRHVARDLYGTAWAFTYPPEDFADAIERYGSRRRERVVVTDLEVYGDPPAYVAQLDAPLWRGTDLPDPREDTRP